MSMGLGALFGGIGSGLSGYVQGEEAGAGIAKEKAEVQSSQLANTEERQKISAVPLMMLQQSIKADPKMFTDANSIAQYNHYAPNLGLPMANPQEGIPQSFATFDLNMVANPSVWVAKQSALEGGALRDASTMLDTAISHGGDPMMAIMSGAAIIRSAGGDPTVWLQGTANNPYYADRANAWYSNKLDQFDANMKLLGIRGDLYTETIAKMKTLVPAEYTDLVNHAGLYTAETGLDKAKTTAVTTGVQQAWARIQNEKTKIMNQYTLGMKNYGLGLGKLSEEQRKDRQNAVTNILATQGRTMASLLQTMNTPGMDPNVKRQILTEMVGDPSTNTLGYTDQLAGMMQTAQDAFSKADAAAPYNPSPGANPGTKVVPHGTVQYNKSETLKITKGPFSGAYTKNGIVGKHDNGKWVVLSKGYSPSKDSAFSKP